MVCCIDNSAQITNEIMNKIVYNATTHTRSAADHIDLMRESVLIAHSLWLIHNYNLRLVITLFPCWFSTISSLFYLLTHYPTQTNGTLNLAWIVIVEAATQFFSHFLYKQNKTLFVVIIKNLFKHI